MITDADYTDDIELLANKPAQAEPLLHSLEWGAGGIGLHVNADKTEFMCFNQRGNISTLNIFTNPSARAGYDTRSFLKRSLAGLNSEFSFS